MKRLLLAMLLVPMIAAAANTNEVIAVRNPFWPIGYKGKLEVITGEIRVEKPKVKEVVKPKEEVLGSAAVVAKAEREAAERTAAERLAAAVESARIITDDHWNAAMRALRIGGRVKVRAEDGADRVSIIINGNTYADGDRLSFNHNNRRFTWQVSGLSDVQNLKLERIKARNLVDPAKEIIESANSVKGVQ